MPLVSDMSREGRTVPVETIGAGLSPHIRLEIDGQPGRFLLDYGATQSWIGTRDRPPPGSTRVVDLALPGVARAPFELRHDEGASSRDGLSGVIGTDILSRLATRFSGGNVQFAAVATDAAILRAQGLTPIPQDGFFSADRARVGADHANVPVVHLNLGPVGTWAQIDTGYDDRVHMHSVDINEALLDRLTTSGVALRPTGTIEIVTCDGRETRPVFRSMLPLSIGAADGAPVATTSTYSLILKARNGCGGIADLDVPAAQLGASFLRLFGTIVFDPASATVWIGHAP